MRTPRILIAAAFALAAAGAGAEEPTAAKRAAVREYMALTDVAGRVERFVDAYRAEWRRRYPDAAPEFWRGEFETIAALYRTEVLGAWTGIYSRELGEAELGELIAFFRSPVGRRFLDLDRRLAPAFDAANYAAASRLNDRAGRAMMRHLEARRSGGE